ncbi:2Fe-2S iron-sulfur cluster-binding protein [Winogradskyella sp.]|nr:2Fe-2S iron-sulfur cluster-binding protein [Winogradskyella sp.]
MQTEYSLKVTHKAQLTKNALVLQFEMPEELARQFQFIPGQYITLVQEINSQEIRRSYSLCSAPSAQEWAVAIKRVDQGVFSNWAHDKLSVGDTIKALPPEGRFILHPDAADQSHYMAFAAGSGITPIMSMIRSVLTQAPHAKFTLVYGNQNKAETMFAEDLADLKNTYPDRFSLVSFYSRETLEGARFGRIEASTVRHLMKQEYADTKFDQFFLCGPEAMIVVLKEVLQEFGGTSTNIHYELFFSVAQEPTESAQGQSTLRVVLDGVTDTFVINKDAPILDAVLAKDLDPPYSCQGGVCSSCIARVTEGKATMIKNQILTDSEVAEGLILTCQALAESDVISIDYDNV